MYAPALGSRHASAHARRIAADSDHSRGFGFDDWEPGIISMGKRAKLPARSYVAPGTGLPLPLHLAPMPSVADRRATCWRCPPRELQVWWCRVDAEVFGEYDELLLP
jgi:hypothetical protein